MATPTLYFNGSTGNDAYSGSGGTALTGTGGSVSSTAAANLSVDAPDLSGVVTDGSVVIRVQTASGVTFTSITAVNNGTKVVTTSRAFGVTASGLTWAIGGKLASMDATQPRRLFTVGDLQPGWIVVLETDQTVTTSVITLNGTGTTSGPITIKGDSEGRLINMTANANTFNSNANGNPTIWHFENLKLTNSNATKTSAIAFNMSGGTISFRRCILGDATNKLLNGYSRVAATPFVIFDDCEVTTCTGVGLNVSGSGSAFLTNVWIHGCTSHGLQMSGNGCVLDNCIINANGGAGINFAAAANSNVPVIVKRCTIHGNTGAGIDMSAGVTPQQPQISSNSITKNGTYGISAASGQNLFQSFIDANNYGSAGSSTNNTSGALSNLNAGPNDLAVDPGYSSSATSNFTPGANLKDEGYPLATRNIGANQSQTVNYSYMGAAGAQAAATAPSVQINNVAILDGPTRAMGY